MSNVSLITSVSLAAILAYMQREVVETTVLLVWCSLMLLASLLRAAIVIAYQRSPAENDAATHVRLVRFRLGVLVAGMVWGSAGLLLFPADHPQYQMFLIFMLAGLTAGGVVSFSVDLVSAIAFSVTVLVPLAVRLFVAGDSLSVAMGMAAMLYLGFMVMALRRINRNMRENIVLRLEAAAREETMRVSEERYRLLLNHSPVGLFHYDTDLVVTYCNDRLADMLHNSVEGITGADMKLIEDQAILPALRKALEGETGYYEGHYHATFSEADRWVDLTCAPFRDSAEKIVGGIAIVQDVTERKQADEMLLSRTSELELHNHTLSRINQHTALPVLLDDLVRQIEAQHPGMICSVLLLDKDGKTLRNGAAPSLPDFYNQAIDGLAIGDETGSCGTAAFRGERVIVEDVREHPYWASFRDLARRAGVQSCWSQPIQNKDGKVLGAFAIYHRQPAQPTDSELALIERYANLVQLAIESYGAQSDLRVSATAFESQEGVLITDANSVILRVNRAFTNITGYTAEEVIGKNPRILSSGRQDANFYAAMWESLRNTGAWDGEIWNRRKSGEIYPEYLALTAVKDPHGIVTNYVATLTDITVSKAAADEIRHLAFYDSLTRLPNRRLLLDRLKQALASSARSGWSGAVLFIDLDNFKTLNDTLGHDIGDMLLQQVAQRLENCVREGDTVARLGGDEFVVMLEELSGHAPEAAAQTENIGEKILVTLNRPYQLAAHICRSTPSIGATLFNGHQQGIDALFKQADIAMYQAKKAGRNTLRFFDPAMQATVTARVTLESDLRHAISVDVQLLLYYQAQVDASGRLVGAEVLVRWRHPERGMVFPAEFIPFAEESGLILPLGHWVLSTACRQLAVWAERPETAHLSVAVNISAKQFSLPTFVEEVLALVDYFGVNPKKLKLEITESMLLDNVDDIIAKMTALKARGINFSMDDFGTGYSSMQYLKRLPLDQIKIDQSFVRDIVADNSDKAIVRTIIAMAQSLGLAVIAEGVETEAQRQHLLNKGCTHFQGYLFGKPVPIDQFEASLKRG